MFIAASGFVQTKPEVLEGVGPILPLPKSMEVLPFILVETVLDALFANSAYLQYKSAVSLLLAMLNLITDTYYIPCSGGKIRLPAF